LIAEGEVLMIDAGSTTLHLARRLAASGKRLSVLTNCIGVATALGAAETVRVVLCPGDYVRQEGGVFGPETIGFLRRFHASRAVIGASGLTVEGATEVDSAAAWVKRAMIERADRRMLVLDHTKFDMRRLEVVAPLDRFEDIVSDADPAGRLREAIAAAGVRLHVAPASGNGAEAQPR
jgi:DeoR/GlpR family transcriptional regulator of sugar metabolism